MGRQTAEEARRNCVGRLAWQTAGRDDESVAKAIYRGEEVDAVYNLDEVGLLDEFFHFLQLIGVFALIEKMQLPGVERVVIPVVQFVSLYMLKVLFGIGSMNALPPLVLSNVAVMTLIGFNAHQVANGFTHRGDDRRQKKPKQGPLTPQCLAQNICKLTVKQMESFFNGVVRLIVDMGFVRGNLTVALDGSKLPTTEKYEGRGCVKVESKAKEKGTGKLVKVVRLVFGWKVLVLIEVRTRLPLATKVVKIEEYEGRWLVPLLKQAQANLRGKARIAKVVIDRGYLDGEDLWQVNQMGIFFVIVAKSGMVVKEDAKALAGEGKVVERVQVVRRGHGRKATTEELKTRLVGIEGLTTYDDYGSEEHARQKNRKDFEGNAINAVVVLSWENKEQKEDKGPVYLTNGSVQDPFAVFDDYDWRSVIENGIFKEGKHPWHLGHFPQKNEAGVTVHVFFTLAVMGLCTAFRLWKARRAPDDKVEGTGESRAQNEGERVLAGTELLDGEGTERWRRRLKEENRNKVIVFVGETYGIFHVAEFSILGGVRIKDIPQELGSRQAILARYGLSP
jgi:hypothetical protein